jgi:hypothetical protein
MTIAGIAAWISYWHMAAVVTRYGEAGTTPYLLPLSVDGLILVASVSLVELSGRIGETGGPHGAVPNATTRRLIPEALHARRGRTTVTSSDAATRLRAVPVTKNPANRPQATHSTATPIGRSTAARSATDVAAAVARLRAQQPSPHPIQIAAEVGRSVRQVLRIIKRLDEQPAIPHEPGPTISATVTRS